MLSSNAWQRCFSKLGMINERQIVGCGSMYADLLSRRFDATDATQAKVDAFAKAIEDKKEKEAAEAALKRQKSLKLFDEPVLNADGSR